MVQAHSLADRERGGIGCKARLDLTVLAKADAQMHGRKRLL